VREFPGLCYVIAGRPFIQDRLAALAQSLGVAEHVQFIGAVEQHELPALYNLCDVFVMVSRTTGGRDVEGYGIVAVEAALSGKPSVVTRNTGLQEAVYDGETGILVDQDDPDGTADAIGRLLRDDALRATMGQRAHDRARAEATWELRAHSFDRLLRTLVDAH
jgi:phosphatidyl-myo-inositol dimannoside synthase